ncbi:MAG: histidine kinase [Firmicutes bacterium]|nr:histidine kinase [Bacillota bacterium]
MRGSPLVSLIKNYRWRSFFVRYFFLTFIPFLALFIAVSVILYINSADRIKSDMRAGARQTLSAVSYSAENVFQSMNAYCAGLRLSDDLSYVLALSDYSNLNFSQTVRTLQDNINDLIVGSNDYLLSVYIYCSRSGYVLSSTTLSPSSPLAGFDDTGWFLSGDSGVRIFRRRLGSDFSNKDVITFCKPYFYGNKVDGYFVANIDCARLERIYGTFTSEKSELLLLDSDKNVLLSAGKDYFTAKPILDSLVLPEAFGQPAAAKSGSGVVMASGLKSAALYVVYAYDTSLEQGALLSPLLFALMALALVLAAATVAFFLTTKFYGVILNILQIFQGSGRLPRAPGKDDELTFINNNILSVINRNKMIENELVRNVFTLNLAQAKALQSQLNPHFIYNTVYLISSLEMAEHKRETDVTTALGLLADILRAALDSGEILVPLEREIEYSRKYLAIENLKNRNKLLVDWDIVQETLPLYVLKLSLQPLLENAVSHGLMPLRGERRLRISAWKDDGQLVIRIHDNGNGIDPKTLGQIRASMNSLAMDRERHLGLHNTNQRLKLIFGEKYGCSIDSGEGGTDVTITMPALDGLQSINLKN